MLAGNKDVQRTASLTARNSGPEAVEVVVLSPKNVQALRTLFNVAHRLHHLLGSAWVLVLDNLSSLDRILDAPSTTTQARHAPWCPTWRSGMLRR